MPSTDCISSTFVGCLSDLNESVADLGTSKHSADISTDSADSDELEQGSDSGDMCLTDNMYAAEETRLLESGEWLFVQLLSALWLKYEHGTAVKS
jgi:hypothetical protein